MGRPALHGELLKLGIEIAQSTVAKYMANSGRGRSNLEDFSAQPRGRHRCDGLPDRADGGLELLSFLVVLSHARRRLISAERNDHPTAGWIAHQITDAFPWDEAPVYMIRDRDASYGHAVTRRLAAMGKRDHPTAPRSPWQNGHAERLIGSIGLECLDHIVVLGETRLRRSLAGYYNRFRTHLFLDKESPSHRGPATWPDCCSADPRRTTSSLLPDMVSGRHTVLNHAN